MGPLLTEERTPIGSGTTAPRQHDVHPRLGSPHELPADVASRTPRAGHLPDARHRVRDWPDQDRVLQVRQRPGHAHRGRHHRTTRYQGRRHGQVGLLLALPVCHRLQGWTAVLSWLEEECAGPGRADGGPLRDQPGDHAGGGEAAELRHRDRGRPDGRRVHRIDGNRHRQRHDRSARAVGGREDETEEQHSSGLRGQLPGGHRLRRLVSLGRGATPAARRHEGREQETGGANVGGRRRLGPGSSPGVQGMEHTSLPAR